MAFAGHLFMFVYCLLFTNQYEARMPYFPHNNKHKKIMVEITVNPPTSAPSTGTPPMLNPPYWFIFFVFARNRQNPSKNILVFGNFNLDFTHPVIYIRTQSLLSSENLNSTCIIYLKDLGIEKRIYLCLRLPWKFADFT